MGPDAVGCALAAAVLMVLALLAIGSGAAAAAADDHAERCAAEQAARFPDDLQPRGERP